METQHIHYFLEICRELNFSRAAKQCGVAQPTITVAIQRMERKVGGALFQRSPHPPYVQLTALGQSAFRSASYLQKHKSSAVALMEANAAPKITVPMLSWR